MSAFTDVMAQAFGDAGAGQDPTTGQSAMEILDAMLKDDAAAYTKDMDETRRQADLVKQLYTEYLWAKQEREKYQDPLWNELYRMYRNQMPDERKSGEWRSKINVPNIWNAVEGAVPHMMEGIFANDQTFQLKAQADDDLVMAHQRLMTWEITDLMDLEQEWEEHQRQKCLYGTSACYTGFRTDYEKRGFWSEKPALDPNAPRELEIKQYDIPTYVGPEFETLDIYNVYPHPRATARRIPWLFLVQYFTKEEAIARKRFKNLDKMSESATVSQPNQDTLIAERRNREGSANQTYSLIAERIYPIITKYDNVKKMVYSFNPYSSILLEEQPYPWFHNEMPIDFDRVTTPTKEFWGVGFAEPVLSLAHEQNMIRNMRRDNENLTNNAILEVRDGDIDDEEEDLVVRPGAVFHSGSGQAVRFLQPPALPDSTQAEVTVKADIDRTTGLSGPIMGEADGITAASGFSLQQKAQLLRLRRALKNECRCYKSVLSKVLALNCQFMPLPEVFKVLGPMHFQNYAPLQVTALMHNATIVVEPAGIYEDEAVLRQQLTNLTNVLAANPQLAQEMDWKQWLKKLLILNGIQDPDSVLKKPSGINIMQSAFAGVENEHMVMGYEIPPASPEDDYDIHTSAHKELIRMRPDLYQSVGLHLYSHDMLKEQQILQQTQMQTAAAGGPGNGGQQGPGSMPPGNKGGVNPARQPQATNQLGMARQQARLTPGH